MDEAAKESGAIGRRTSRRRVGQGWETLALAVVTILMLGVTTSSGTRAASPAEGHSQVIAQGVAAMPRADVGWRVVGMEAQPIEDAPIAERSLGFVLVDDGAVLITDEDTSARTLLAEGEASLAQQGSRQQRASTDDDPATYYALELVVAEALENEATIGDGDLLFAGDAFGAPPGERDMNLVRDVLDDGESGRLDATVHTLGDGTGYAFTLGDGETLELTAIFVDSEAGGRLDAEGNNWQYRAGFSWPPGAKDAGLRRRSRLKAG